jgi:predicted nucleotidyltransferase
MLRDRLSDLCREHCILALYLFGSRAADGLGLLDGGLVDRAGSDLDIGVVFPAGGPRDHRELARLQIELEELFAPLRVDLVRLDRVDALFQFAAIDGHRVAVLDDDRADRWELDVMRRAAELLPIQRWIERETFGVATT